MPTKSNWSLFLDDKRDPPSDDWDLAKTVEEAIKLVEAKGPPSEMSLDFSLGWDQRSGDKFVDWFCDQVWAGSFRGSGTAFAVHSSAMYEPLKMCDKLEACLQSIPVAVGQEWWWHEGQEFETLESRREYART